MNAFPCSLQRKTTLTCSGFAQHPTQRVQEQLEPPLPLVQRYPESQQQQTRLLKQQQRQTLLLLLLALSLRRLRARCPIRPGADC